MLLHLLYWNNGLEFGDREETLIGIYASEDDLAAAETRYKFADCWPFTGREKGGFFHFSVKLGEDLYRQ